MSARTLALRYWVVGFVLFYLVGFLAPWQWLTHSNDSTLWLTSSTLLGRTGWFSLASATEAVTLGALLCLLLGVVFSVWSGFARRPLYVATWLQALGASVLMPLSGAAFFLTACSLLTVFLVAAGKPFAPRPSSVASLSRPWIQILIAQLFPISFTVCFALFAWRYNAHILIRCLLVCYGVSLVAQALVPREKVLTDAPVGGGEPV